MKYIYKGKKYDYRELQDPKHPKSGLFPYIDYVMYGGTLADDASQVKADKMFGVKQGTLPNEFPGKASEIADQEDGKGYLRFMKRD